MHICLVSYKNNPLSISKELGKALAKRISGVEVEERFVPLAEDIPVVAMEAAEEADFVFVFALLEDEELVDFLKQKLIDVELATKTRILKAVSEDNFSGTNEEDYNEKKELLVKEYADLIVGILFDEQSFSPKDKDFSL